MQDAHREGVHPATDEEAWQESVFLAWRDAERGVGGVHRIGIEPNRGLSNMWCAVFREGGAAFRLNQEGLPLEKQSDLRGFRCDVQSFEHDDDAIRWRIQASDCGLELEIEDHPGGDLWAGTPDGLMDATLKGHFHHHCVVRGHLRLGADRFDVDGHGWRDHSWGPRYWETLLGHRCLSGVFEGGAFADFGMLLEANGRLSRFGTLVRGGKTSKTDDYTFTVAVDVDGLTAQTADIRGRLPDGEFFRGHYTLAGGCVVETREHVGIETVGELTMDSGDTGFGYMALSLNSRGGRSKPPLALHALYKNGFFPSPNAVAGGAPLSPSRGG